MKSIERGLYVIAALVLAVISVLLAFGTLPSRTVAQDTGRLVPWLISWSLAWIVVVSAVIVAGFLLLRSGRPR